MEELAHAKVNLFLRVLRRREDGFHEIETLVAPITLHDSLLIEPADRLEFYCDQPGLAGDDNLVVRAARAFFAETNREAKSRLTLRKKIPHGAGLGGGSSDAAATLRGLNRFFDTKLSSKTFGSLAAKLGSDVPFFVNEKAATCSLLIFFSSEFWILDSALLHCFFFSLPPCLPIGYCSLLASSMSQ